MSQSHEHIPFMNTLYSSSEAHPGHKGNVILFSADLKNFKGGTVMETGKLYRVEYQIPYPFEVRIDENTLASVAAVEGLFEIFRAENIHMENSAFPPIVSNYTLRSDVTRLEQGVRLPVAGSISRTQLEHLAIPVLTAARLTLGDNVPGTKSINKSIFSLKFRDIDRVIEKS